MFQGILICFLPHGNRIVHLFLKKKWPLSGQKNNTLDRFLSLFNENTNLVKVFLFSSLLLYPWAHVLKIPVYHVLQNFYFVLNTLFSIHDLLYFFRQIFWIPVCSILFERVARLTNFNWTIFFTLCTFTKFVPVVFDCSRTKSCTTQFV